MQIKITITKSNKCQVGVRHEDMTSCNKPVKGCHVRCIVNYKRKARTDIFFKLYTKPHVELKHE
jgi:hypothetical protein